MLYLSLYLKRHRARYYELTPSGRRALAQQQADWEQFSQAIGLIMAVD